MCGHGNQKRNIVCRREDGVDVARHLCEEGDEPIPVGLADCEVLCPLDCEVSEWEEWEECSSICGYGKTLTEIFFQGKLRKIDKTEAYCNRNVEFQAALDIQVYQ